MAAGLSARAIAARNRVRQRQFLIVGAAQKPPDHFETFVIKFEFLCQIGSIHKQMKMIGVGQVRIVRVAPPFGIEVQTKHKIGMQFEVHQRRAASNLAIAIEQNFALPANGLLFRRIIGIENVGARLWHAIFDQNFSGELPKIIRTLRL